MFSPVMRSVFWSCRFAFTHLSHSSSGPFSVIIYGSIEVKTNWKTLNRLCAHPFCFRFVDPKWLWRSATTCLHSSGNNCIFPTCLFGNKHYLFRVFILPLLMYFPLMALQQQTLWIIRCSVLLGGFPKSFHNFIYWR